LGVVGNAVWDLCKTLFKNSSTPENYEIFPRQAAVVSLLKKSA